MARIPARTALVALLAAPFLAACSGAEAESGAALTTAQAGIPAPVLAEPLRPAEPQVVDVSGLGHAQGDPEAPIQVVEFTDFGCGYCKKFHDETWSTLRSRYVAEGQIFWRVVHFNVGMFPNAQEAALAGECAFAQDRWDAMRAGLFAAQRDWKGTGDAAAVFQRVAREAGLDVAAFDACMSAREPEPGVDQANEAARKLGVRGTPTFYVDGYPVQGAAPLELFEEFFDRLIEAKAQAGAD